jgi:alanine racemase
LRGDDAGVAQGDSESQFVQFAKAMSAFRGLKVHAHALNSGGTVGAWKRALTQQGLGKEEVGPLGARPGISIYGVQAAADPALAIDLKPVMSLKSRIVLTKKVAKGDVVSYGATWRADRPSLIGVIPFGYADGWARALSNKGSVLCRGQRVPIAGIVCMDYFMVDLTDIKEPVQNGEEVVLIGEQKGQRILAEDVAQMTGTIAYEVLTRVSDRVPRRFVGASSVGAKTEGAKR